MVRRLCLSSWYLHERSVQRLQEVTLPLISFPHGGEAVERMYNIQKIFTAKIFCVWLRSNSTWLSFSFLIIWVDLLVERHLVNFSNTPAGSEINYPSNGKYLSLGVAIWYNWWFINWEKPVGLISHRLIYSAASFPKFLLRVGLKPAVSHWAWLTDVIRQRFGIILCTHPFSNESGISISSDTLHPHLAIATFLFAPR